MVFPCFYDSFKLSFSYYDQLISSNHDLTLDELALLITGTHSYTWIKKDAVRVISMIRCNFLQSLKKFFEGDSEPP